MIAIPSLTDWKDKYGWIHLDPNPTYDQSENHPMYYSIIICLYLKLVKENKADWDRSIINEYLAAFKSIYNPVSKVWRLSPEQVTESDFSLDNFTGVISALLMIKKLSPEDHQKQKAQKYIDALPLFHKQMDHPKDFSFVLLAKYPIAHLLILPLVIIWGAQIVTFWEGYKVRGGNRIIKTDGKILAVLRSLSMPFSVGLIWPLLKLIFEKKNHKANTPDEMPEGYYSSAGMKNNKYLWNWNGLSSMFHYYFKNKSHVARYLAANLFEE